MDEEVIRRRLRDVGVKYGWHEGVLSLDVSRDDRRLWMRLWIRFSDYAGVMVDAEELREMANALDGHEDATAAAMQDLKEESAAYQKGHAEGIELAIRELDAHRLDTTAQLLRERIGCDRTK